MDIKEWNQYSKEEKEIILRHWWFYYGKLLVNFNEIEQFANLLETNIDEIFTVAVCSYMEGLSSQILIGAMRQGKVDELFNALPKIDLDDEKMLNAFKSLSNNFLNEVVSTLNKPEPNIPMSDEEILKQLF